ncbi:MAG: enoyl-CoA hydratase/isomerase family protein [Acidocella sp.]|nr:enoyl-CoA hydratase/isomerase family protein [Acidocella sp.]
MDQVVTIWTERRAGRIRLNRPKALNALDMEMVALIRAGIAQMVADPDVQFILVDAPLRGFCAGGDVRTLRNAGLNGDDATIRAFFTAEYAMNLEIATCPKPFISLIDGVCMGGGIGLSVHGSHRIATENAMFAMPETAIALFPDVGTSYLLPRLPGALGFYLGLTGARMAGADAVHAGFATHFTPAAALAALGDALTRDGPAVIASFAAPLPRFSLSGERGLIDHAFSAASVPEIVHILSKDGGTFAQATLGTLRTHSPSSVYWSFEIMRRNARRSLADSLTAELALVTKIAMHPEFHEGVRAVLVDKDRRPQWRPASLENVDQSAINALFAGTP